MILSMVKEGTGETKVIDGVRDYQANRKDTIASFNGAKNIDKLPNSFFKESPENLDEITFIYFNLKNGESMYLYTDCTINVLNEGTGQTVERIFSWSYFNEDKIAERKPTSPCTKGLSIRGIAEEAGWTYEDGKGTPPKAKVGEEPIKN